ncbi:hypothetical protein FH972_022739 [Carpinus fangiana]|nr:hypothetical protein FH972_022739 [Carpinus fangiana]
MINAIILKGAGEKALCAGGDVAVLANQNREGPEGRQASKDYFALEYKLDHLIATYPKPYIAFMDGITMGGGVGLSVHAPFKIATERTVFAMPETTIGFFPEVGASFFLPRMDGQLGKYLALTSERLKGVQAYYAGVASHYIHSSSLPDLENRLAELTIPDYASLDDRYKVINSAIAEFATTLPHNEQIQLSGPLRKLIDECFGPNKVEDIFAKLDEKAADQGLPEHLRKWAQKTAATMKERSPTSLKVTCKQMVYGKDWNIAQAFDREHRIASHFMDHPDFTEGVSARLIRKPAETPKWQPVSISDVSEQDADEFFRTREGDAPPLQLLNKGPGTTYHTYPHAWLSLPTERSILDYISKGSKSEAETVAYFVKLQDGKPGVREKVEEVIARARS